MNYVQTKTLDNHHCSEEGFPGECFALHERFFSQNPIVATLGMLMNFSSTDNILGCILLLRISTKSAVV